MTTAIPYSALYEPPATLQTPLPDPCRAPHSAEAVRASRSGQAHSRGPTRHPAEGCRASRASDHSRCAGGSPLSPATPFLVRLLLFGSSSKEGALSLPLLPFSSPTLNAHGVKVVLVRWVGFDVSAKGGGAAWEDCWVPRGQQRPICARAAGCLFLRSVSIFTRGGRGGFEESLKEALLSYQSSRPTSFRHSQCKFTVTLRSRLYRL